MTTTRQPTHYMCHYDSVTSLVVRVTTAVSGGPAVGDYRYTATDNGRINEFCLTRGVNTTVRVGLSQVATVAPLTGVAPTDVPAVIQQLYAHLYGRRGR